jgi:hypothetical protein
MPSVTGQLVGQSRAVAARRFRVMTLAIGLLLATTACRGTVSAGVAYQLPIIPIKLALDFTIPPDGPISVGGSIGIVTEFGTFSAEADFTPSDNPAHIKPGPNETIVIIRHRSTDGNLADSVYGIRTGEELIVVIDGRTVLNIYNREILINAAAGHITKLTVRNAINAQGPVITRVTTYVQGPDVYVRVNYYDPIHNAAGFGFVGADGYAWAEEQHPFSSPSYGIVGPDYVEYPFNSGCGTSEENASYIQFWIYDRQGMRTKPITVQIACNK